MPIAKSRREPVPANCLIASIYGDEKTGKTRFSLTFPEPIKLINLDWGADRAWRPLLREFPGLDVEAFDINQLKIGDPADAATTLRDFYDTYLHCLQTLNHAGTVVVDTATQVNQLIQTVKIHEIRSRRAKREGKDEAEINVYPYDYAQANNFMSSIVRAPFSEQFQGVSAVFIDRTTDEYQGKEPTGRTRHQGWREMAAATQVHVRLRREGGTGGAIFKATIEACGDDPNVIGTTFENPTYAELLSYVY